MVGRIASSHKRCEFDGIRHLQRTGPASKGGSLRARPLGLVSKASHSKQKDVNGGQPRRSTPATKKRKASAAEPLSARSCTAPRSVKSGSRRPAGRSSFLLLTLSQATRNRPNEAHRRPRQAAFRVGEGLAVCAGCCLASTQLA